MGSSSKSKESTPPWLELPREITASILLKLGAIEILTTAQRVCSLWRSVFRDATMWRSINMRNDGSVWVMPYDLEKMCRHAVDRSEGQLIDINIEYFGTDDMLLYISRRCTQLRTLRLVFCDGITGEGLIKAVQKWPLLEELHLYYTPISVEAITDIGHSCAHLKSFKLNNRVYKLPHIACDLEAPSIAESMPELRHLQLIGNKMTTEGLQAILDGCPHLESLDLRQCFNVYLGGDLGTLCSQRIKELRCPNDPMDDYEFDATVHDYESSEDDYITGFSDVDMVSDYDDCLVFSGGSVSSDSHDDDDVDDMLF